MSIVERFLERAIVTHKILVLLRLQLVLVYHWNQIFIVNFFSKKQNKEKKKKEKKRKKEQIQNQLTQATYQIDEVMAVVLQISF